MDILSLAKEKKFPSGIDEKGWKRVAKEAQYHSLSGYLSEVLKSEKADVPPQIFESLSSGYAPAWRDSLAYLAILEKVEKLFSVDGIDLIVLKGPHVAQEIYRSFKQRPMSDLDILVKKAHVEKAHKSMKKISVPENWNITWIEKYHYHYGYTVSEKIYSGVKPLKIEVHWNLLPPDNPFLLDMEEVWADATNVQIGNVKCKVLSKEHLLLYLCLHIAFLHVFQVKLLHFLDIGLFLKKEEIQWQKFSEIAHETKAIKAVGLVAKAVNALFGVELPEELSEIVQKASIDENTLEDALIFSLKKQQTVHTSFSRFKKKSGFLRNLVSLYFSLFPTPKHIIEMEKIEAPFPDVFIAYVSRVISLFKRRIYPFAEIYKNREEFSKFMAFEEIKEKIIDKITM
ncbi:nucleotidyltransferase family protein [candidate division WOR-3 bacterium]|nr:nucleotidyltransferase family protein [candidate division WOR-3 bacterium]